MRTSALMALGLALGWASQAQEPRIVEIRFEGLKNIPSHTVEAVLTVKVGEPYSREKAQQNLDAIYSLGYFADVRLQPRLVEDGIALVFLLVENPVIQEIRFQDNTALSSQALEEQLIANKRGRVFNSRSLTRDAEALMDYYRAQGYVAEVFPEFRPDLGLLNFRVVEYRVERIEVTGNRKTRAHSILRVLWTKPGDLWSPRRFSEQDLRELMNLGIFEEVPQVKPDLGSEPGKVVLRLEVKERKTGTLAGGAGYSSRFGLLGFFDLSDTNFLGRVEQVNARVEFGGRRSYEFHYFDPWVDSHRTTLRLDIYDSTFDRFTTSATDFAVPSGLPFTRRTLVQRRRGGEFILGRPLNVYNRMQVGFKAETVTTERLSSSLIPSLPSLPFLALRGDTTRSLSLGFIHDTRDYFLDPSRGERLSFDLEWAGGPWGGDNRFAKYVLDARRYWPLYPHTILAGRLQIGLSSGRVPFSQIYFVGGVDSLRGYQEDRFFGNRMFLMNWELRRRITQNLQGVLFFDVGRAWREAERVRVPRDLVAGFGVGMRVSTPLGPLRLDLAKGKEGTRTHFGFAQLF